MLVDVCWFLINSYIHPLYIWNAHCVPGTVFSARDTAMNNIDVKLAINAQPEVCDPFLVGLCHCRGSFVLKSAFATDGEGEQMQRRLRG